jgi:hypothetical protein
MLERVLTALNISRGRADMERLSSRTTIACDVDQKLRVVLLESG